jgi:RNA polymerase sigma factor (sigma-70 family)
MIDTSDTLDLANKARCGDRQALEQLLSDDVFRTRVKIIARTMYRRIPHPRYRDAEDLEQDIYERVLEKISRFDGPSLGTWINRIAWNLQIDHLRRSKGESQHLPTIEWTIPAPQSNALAKATLMSILGTLPERHQRAVLYRASGLDLKEIAARLHISVGQVSKDLKAAEEVLLAAG